MKKFFLVVILVFALCVTSCGIKTTESLTICTEPEYTPIINTLISCYNKVYPEVEFKILTLPSEAEEREAAIKRIQTQTMAGEGPDIFLLPAQYESDDIESREPLFSNINKVMSSGVLLDLTPYLEEDKSFQRENYQKAILQSGVYEGKQYVLPLCYQIPVLFLKENVASAIHLEEKVSSWSFEELQKFMSGQSDPGIHYIGCAWNRMTTQDYLASCIDYPNKDLQLSEKDIFEILSSEQRFLEKYPIYEKALKENMGYLAENAVLLEDPRDGVYPQETEDYETGVFLLQKNKEGKVLGRVAVYTAVSRTCAFPEEAFQFVKLFLDPGFQSGDFLTIKTKDNKPLSGIYDQVFHKNIPICKDAWTEWMQHQSSYSIPEDAFASFKKAVDYVDHGILCSEVDHYTYNLLKPLYEGDGINLEETAEVLYEFYDKTAKE